jgi:lactoylglutathione lyase
MSEVRALHHTGCTVADLERSLRFYRDLLGMEVVARQEKRGGYLGRIVGHPDAHVRMAHLRLPGGAHMLELFRYLTPPDVGTTHLCLAVEDLQALHTRLRRAGVDTFVSPPVEIDTGVNAGGWALYLRDPDGFLVELFQPG